MAELLELKPASAPATVLESEGTGREREEGEGVLLWRLGAWETQVGYGPTAATVAMAMASRNSWGALLR